MADRSSRAPAPPDMAIRLFGEPRPPTAARDVVAGRLSFRLDGMALGWIRWDGIEVLRGIAFVVRDRDWGTYEPEVTVEAEERSESGVVLRLAALIPQDGARLACRVVVNAGNDGLSISGEATASGAFHTNRTGFVVLHPVSCAGAPIRVERVGGSIADASFPRLINPHQPFFDIAAIEHQPAPGITARVAFSGEVFEMEDHRNWTDASFKTYCRPLAHPYPYVVGDGETVAQAVRLSVRGNPGGSARRRGETVRIVFAQAPAGRLPRLGIGGRLSEYAGTDAQEARLAAIRPAVLLVELGPGGDDRDDPAGFRAAVAASGATPAVMLRATEGGLARLEGLVRAGLRPAEIALVADDPAALEAARRIAPGARIGAGTDAFFTEFNRRPPPPADFQFWTANPTVHATDDASVMSTLAALADQVMTARARYPTAPLWCGPVTLRMRFNPNANWPNATWPNAVAPGAPPANADARQRGLFGAAFTLGQITSWAAAGLETLLLHAPFGPRGLVHARAPFPQPWYDGLPDGAVYPAWHVLAGLAPHSAGALRRVRNEAEEQVAALALPGAIWLANLGGETIAVQVQGSRARTLDADSFAEAATEPLGFWDRGQTGLNGGALRLLPYSVARATGA